MKKLGLTGRAWLKGLHVFMAGTWVGTGICMVLLLQVKGLPADGDELYAVNAAAKLLDDWIIIPMALGTALTGFLMCWLTNWGFFKHRWIIVKWIVTAAAILFGTFALGPWINGMVTIADVQRLDALRDATYMFNRQQGLTWGAVQAVILAATVFISVIKPWRPKK